MNVHEHFHVQDARVLQGWNTQALTVLNHSGLISNGRK